MPYLLFCGAVDYPAGGADDFAGAFATVAAAKAYFAAHPAEWAHIATFDGVQMTIVCAYSAGEMTDRIGVANWHDCQDAA